MYVSTMEPLSHLSSTPDRRLGYCRLNSGPTFSGVPREKALATRWRLAVVGRRSGRRRLPMVGLRRNPTLRPMEPLVQTRLAKARCRRGGERQMARSQIEHLSS